MSDGLSHLDDGALVVVDGTFTGRQALRVEDDQQTLDAYACHLWEEWQTPAKGRKSAAIKAGAVWLTEQYAEAKLPIADELALLIRAIVSPTSGAAAWSIRKTNMAAYRAAIEFEASFPAEPTKYKVAKYLVDQSLLHSSGNANPQKSAESVVKGWRKSPHYQACVHHRRMELQNPA